MLSASSLQERKTNTPLPTTKPNSSPPSSEMLLPCCSDGFFFSFLMATTVRSHEQINPCWQSFFRACGQEKRSSLPPPVAHFLPLVLFSIITRKKLCRFSVLKKKKKKPPITLYMSLRPQWHCRSQGKLSYPSVWDFQEFLKLPCDCATNLLVSTYPFGRVRGEGVVQKKG